MNTANFFLDESSLTPMMRQWAMAKKQHPDCILLFRMGDFYELFADDAIMAAPILDLTLTCRDKEKSGLKMAGFPFSAAQSYIEKLINQGLKVAICEQLEDPKNKKGIVKRGVTEVITPATFLSEDLSYYKENYLCALVFSKEKWALAFLDILSANFMITQSKDEKSIKNEISRLSPKEVLIFDDQQEPLELLTQLKDNKFRIEKMGFFEINRQKHLIPKDCSLEENQALLLILNYVIKLQGKLPKHLKSPKRYLMTEHLFIDEATKENLHLFPKKKGDLDNLFENLNLVKTAMGKRFLYKALLAPLTDLKELYKRQDLLGELLSQPKLRLFFADKFSEIYDLPKLIALIDSKKITPKGLAQLRDSILIINQIKKNIKEFSLSYCDKIINDLPDLEEIYQELNNSLIESPPINIKDGQIFKKNYNKELDELYFLSEGGQQRLLDIEKRERENTGISSLKVRYTRVFGYYIEVTKTHLEKVPKEYIRKQTIAGGERYVTEELSELEVKLNSAKEAVFLLEEKLFFDLRLLVNKYAEKILTASNSIAFLDFINALAEKSSLHQYKRPVLLQKEDGVLKIKDGRHPIAESICQKEGQIFISNDFLLDQHSSSLVLITGPNMAGKSTIMRQIAMIQVMAQLGCFVPAKEATLSLVDAIFARVGASDDLSMGRSTFMVEMSETAQILSSATPHSLILLDEIGRGTSTYDGMAIAQAVCEYLHNHLKARTIFATHYHELTHLEKFLFRLKNMHVLVGQVKDQIHFFYKLAEGPLQKSFGVEVAKLAGLPTEVISRAKEVLLLLENKDKPKPKISSFGNNIPQLDLF